MQEEGSKDESEDQGEEGKKREPQKKKKKKKKKKNGNHERLITRGHDGDETDGYAHRLFGSFLPAGMTSVAVRGVASTAVTVLYYYDVRSLKERETWETNKES